MPNKRSWYSDPREFYGIMGAIPKQTLRTIANSYGSIRALAAEFSKYGRNVTRSALSMWICGTRRMSDTDIIYVAEALRISPLYVLDLARYDRHALLAYRGDLLGYLRDTGLSLEPEATHCAMTRDMVESLADTLANDYDSDAAPIAPDAKSLALELLELADWQEEPPQTCGELKTMLKALRGDYRDVAALAIRATEYYAAQQAPGVDEGLLGAVFRAGLKMKVS